MKNLILFLLLSALASFALADDPDEVTIFFSNGVNNTAKEAKKSLSELNSQLGTSLNGRKAEYKLAYNPTENVLLDLVETYQQQIDSGQISGPPNQIWTGLLWVIGIGTENPAVIITAAANQILLNQLAKVQEISGVIVNQHAALYRKEIRDKQGSVLIVAHSQGNLYSNAAWSAVYADNLWLYNQNQFRSLGLLSVATPANGVGYALAEPDARGLVTRYVTLTDDKVINVARLLSGSLPANSTNAKIPVGIDSLHHGFVESYLGGQESRTQIIQAAHVIISQLEPAYQTTETNSTALRQAGFNPNTNELDVEFLSSGSIYRYSQVPIAIYTNLIQADSVGSYYNASIRGKYPSQRLR